MISPVVREWLGSVLGNVVVAAIVGGIVGGAIPLLVGWWSRPELRIDFRNDADNVVSGSIYHKDGTLIEYIWLRVRVRNVGQRIAKTCQVYLTSLYKVLPGGKTAPDPVLSDAKIVQWAGGSKSPIDIPQGIDLYADLLSVPKASGGSGNDLRVSLHIRKCWICSMVRMNFTLWSLATMRSPIDARSESNARRLRKISKRGR